jgi:mycofactocin glycosyltransferase
MAEGLKVVVIDDGSTDNSSAVAKELGATVIRHEVALGPAAARNRGLVATGTARIAFVDSDCMCTYGWLPILLQHFHDPAVALVAPRIFGAIADLPLDQQHQSTRQSGQQPGQQPAPQPTHQRTHQRTHQWTPTDSPALASYEAVRSPLDLGPAQALIVPRTRVSYVPSAALVARTEVLRALDGFATGLQVGEDVDLLWRLHRAGWRSRYEPRATVAHDHRVSWQAFAKRRMQYGTSAALLDERHPGQVAPLAVSGWSALGWLSLCTLSPVGIIGGLGVMAATTALLPRKLRVAGNPNKLAFELASRGHFGAGRQLADATWRAYLPLALATSFAPFLAPTARRILCASAVIPNVQDWRSKRPKLDPLRYVGIRLLDDASYCVGVWAGAIRQRSLRALKPDFTSWPGKSNKPTKTLPENPTER